MIYLFSSHHIHRLRKFKSVFTLYRITFSKFFFFIGSYDIFLISPCPTEIDGCKYYTNVRRRERNTHGMRRLGVFSYLISLSYTTSMVYTSHCAEEGVVRPYFVGTTVSCL